jgi:SAM-dependent methyltransferase
LAETLETLEMASNYLRWIFALIEPHLGSRILEVGAGHGTFTELLAPGRTVIATELSRRCLDELHHRFSGCPEVTVLEADVAAAADLGPYDTAVLVNVLEHIEDDAGALRDLRSLLRPGGRLLLWVPAFQALYSDFDRRVGHHRRYRIPGLRSQLLNARFEPVELRYANLFGAIAWWVFSRQLRRNPTSPRSATAFDRLAVPWVRAIERHIRPPFGQSIFAVAVRPT